MYLIKVVLLAFILINFKCHAFGSNVTQQADYSIASKFTINSTLLNEDRAFFVSLPESYDKSSSTYPVLILLDGAQNLEHSVASARLLSKWKGIPEVIIVAIPSINRIKDFTPTKDINYAKDSGGADKFAMFIEKEVMEFVDKHYRTHPFRILEGHSLGGLFATEQFLIQNSFYNGYVIISPALWWDGYYALNKMQGIDKSKIVNDTRIYFGIGEHDGHGMKQELKQFFDSLLTKSSAKEFYVHRVYDGEGHMSATLPTMYDGLLHVFKDAKYQQNLWPEFSSSSFIEFIAKTKAVFGSSVIQTGELFNQLAQHLINKGDFDGAITVLKENIASYPKYPFNHEELANVYALNEQPDLAIEQYRKAAKYASESSSYGDGVANRYLEAISVLENPIIYQQSTLKLFAGCYVSESDSTSMFKFSLEQNNLNGSREGWQDFRLFSDQQNQFFMRTQPKFTYEFKKHEVHIFAYGQKYIYKKVSCIKKMI